MQSCFIKVLIAINCMVSALLAAADDGRVLKWSDESVPYDRKYSIDKQPCYELHNLRPLARVGQLAAICNLDLAKLPAGHLSSLSGLLRGQLRDYMEAIRAHRASDSIKEDLISLIKAAQLTAQADDQGFFDDHFSMQECNAANCSISRCVNPEVRDDFRRAVIHLAKQCSPRTCVLFGSSLLKYEANLMHDLVGHNIEKVICIDSVYKVWTSRLTKGCLFGRSVPLDVSTCTTFDPLKFYNENAELKKADRFIRLVDYSAMNSLFEQFKLRLTKLFPSLSLVHMYSSAQEYMSGCLIDHSLYADLLVGADLKDVTYRSVTDRSAEWRDFHMVKKYCLRATAASALLTEGCDRSVYMTMSTGASVPIERLKFNRFDKKWHKDSYAHK